MEIPRGCFQVSRHIAELQLAIEIEHDCVATPLVTMPVYVSSARLEWRGMVAAFELGGHLFADRCYAWPIVAGDAISFTTMLKVAPITSAEDAVRSWLRTFDNKFESRTGSSLRQRVEAVARLLLLGC